MDTDKLMNSDSRQKQIGYTILETVDRHGTISNTVLFSRVEREFPDVDGREYADALTQLRELNLLHSFDGGYDRIHEVSRQGSCMLARDS